MTRPDLTRTSEPLRYVFNEPSTWIGLANAGYTTIVGLAVNQRRVDVCNKVCTNTIYKGNPNFIILILGLGHCKCGSLKCNQNKKSKKTWPRPLWPATDSNVINAINFNLSIYLLFFGMSSLNIFCVFRSMRFSTLPTWQHRLWVAQILPLRLPVPKQQSQPLSTKSTKSWPKPLWLATDMVTYSCLILQSKGQWNMQKNVLLLY